MKGVRQNGYHHLDVFEHSLTAVAELENILAQPDSSFQETAGYVADYAGQGKKPALLKLAALFHDAGKPATQDFREDQERYTFYHHEQVGVAIFAAVAARLRFSQEENRTVTRLIDLHMRPFLLLPDFKKGTLSQRAVGRFIKAARPELAGVFLLAMADSLAGKGASKPPDAEKVLADFCDQVYLFLKERLEPMEQRPKWLTGADLIQELHLTPGPEFRRLLTAVEEAAVRRHYKEPGRGSRFGQKHDFRSTNRAIRVAKAPAGKENLYPRARSANSTGETPVPPGCPLSILG